MVNVDPAETAVLILDLQNEVIHEKGAFGGTGAAAHAVEQDVVANAARLASAARSAGSPVIHVHQQRSVGASSGAAVEYAVAHLSEVATVDELVAALDKG